MSSAYQSRVPTWMQSNQSQAFRNSFRANAARVYSVKVYWLVGLLSSLILTLIVAVYFLTTENEIETKIPDQAPVQNALASHVRILLAKERIEANDEIRPEMFVAQEVGSSAVPEGAVLENDAIFREGLYAREVINAGFPLNRIALTKDRPSRELPIPAGYRAVTIPIDEVSSVAYQTKPNSRVDVMLSYTDETGQPALTCVVSTAKVLSMGTEQNNKNAQVGAHTATILVSAEDSMRVELSKRLGTLSLILAGTEEMPKTYTNSRPINKHVIFGTQEAKSKQKVDGIFSTVDPKTGRIVQRALVNNRWSQGDSDS